MLKYTYKYPESLDFIPLYFKEETQHGGTG